MSHFTIYVTFCIDISVEDTQLLFQKGNHVMPITEGLLQLWSVLSTGTKYLQSTPVLLHTNLLCKHYGS